MSDVPAEEAVETFPTQKCDATGTKRPCTYTVVTGDTLTGIAEKFKVKYPDDIRRWNPDLFPPKGDPNKIYAGRTRVIIKKAGAK
jgi:LysM repeat protein